ncbi:mersacidin/lichenicidin family type 2 lantibiotic [Glycomyces harbinensis]|uniref:Type 2 lantibiotic, mersacidin/lichenicidin family n=1 Tax=Glycomyces harbinensis TaxID=58114 RepID=A0A1G7DBZ8_9ACTN|nr:mersacidin/lichenicidin family type 2 lantibiotic [Glycomyces harbinensis]SDE49091.1 type 2 lantibiotic, mersacidin/lichenicidin family [Glycomyces harbinensis]
MKTTRAWKDPEYRRELGEDAQNNPAGLVDLNDDAVGSIAGGSTWGCVTATIALTVTVCSPTGTLCGSCQMGTRGCC